MYRLTAADYSSGEFFDYSYDRVGNRLTQDALAGTNTYTYDDANRLTSVDGVAYTWDAKGNLLSDGVSTYTYDHGNRLTAVTQGTDTYGFAYNGLGDRLQQTVNDVSIDYTLDINRGLTQVLADGANTYLYGLGRIGEQQPAGWQYHHGDALGSVRQLTDPGGAVTAARAYEPFGSTLTTTGSASTNYAFTGEWADGTGLVHLRARYLDPAQGRFLQLDQWDGRSRQPQSFHKHLYATNNPINRVDRSGMYPVPALGASCPEFANPDRKWCEIRDFAQQRTDASEEPPHITWSPSINVGKASQVGANQYIVRVRDPLTGDISQLPPNAWGANLCGQIVVSMVLEQITGQDFLLGNVQEALDNTRQTTIGSELAKGILRTFPSPDQWSVWVHSWGYSTRYSVGSDGVTATALESLRGSPYWYGAEGHLPSRLRGMLFMRHYSIPLVHIKASGALVGRNQSSIKHWVLVTGMSASWKDAISDSLWNWVRINNPFENREEYYTWEEFHSSLAGSRSLVEFWRNPQPRDWSRLIR